MADDETERLPSDQEDGLLGIHGQALDTNSSHERTERSVAFHCAGDVVPSKVHTNDQSPER